MNTKLIGTIGIGKAIAYYTSIGCIVSIPLNDSQPYDLIIDKESKLLKVEVKFTNTISEYNIYYADLRTTGGNKSRTSNVNFDKTLSDILFICCGDGSMYAIPTSEVTVTTKISLGDKVKAFKIKD